MANFNHSLFESNLKDTMVSCLDDVTARALRHVLAVNGGGSCLVAFSKAGSVLSPLMQAGSDFQCYSWVFCLYWLSMKSTS